MKKAPPIEFDGTRVDLGDDLLQTRTIQRAATPGADVTPAPTEKTSSEPAVEGPDELVVNAKILRGEGLLEEAKRSLRRALIQDPTHLPARQLLDLIQSDEVKDLVRGGEGKKGSRLRAKKSPLDTNETPSEIMLRLESDLGLNSRGAGSEPYGSDSGEPFGSAAVKADFLRSIDEQLGGSSGESRVDLGIAFMEMGLCGLARTQFEIARRDPLTERKASLLLARCLLEEREPFEALLLLDPLMADAARAPEEKLEAGYLMARAYEDLMRWPEAVIWYRGVAQVDAEYRDTLERLERCEKIHSSSSR